jgi:hypothetical protein
MPIPVQQSLGLSTLFRSQPSAKLVLEQNSKLCPSQSWMRRTPSTLRHLRHLTSFHFWTQLFARQCDYGRLFRTYHERQLPVTSYPFPNLSKIGMARFKTRLGEKLRKTTLDKCSESRLIYTGLPRATESSSLSLLSTARKPFGVKTPTSSSALISLEWVVYITLMCGHAVLTGGFGVNHLFLRNFLEYGHI